MSEIVWDCVGLCGIVLDCVGLYDIVLDFVGLCENVLDCVRLCWIVWDWGGRWDGLGEHRLFVTTWLIDVGRG